MKASKPPSIFRNLQLGQTMSSEMTFSLSNCHIQSETIRHLSPMVVSNVSGRLSPRMEYVGGFKFTQKSAIGWVHAYPQILHKQVINRTNPRTPAEREALALILGKLSMYFSSFLGYLMCSCLIQWNLCSSNIAVKEMWDCVYIISIVVRSLTQS